MTGYIWTGQGYKAIRHAPETQEQFEAREAHFRETGEAIHPRDFANSRRAALDAEDKT